MSSPPPSPEPTDGGGIRANFVGGNFTVQAGRDVIAGDYIVNQITQIAPKTVAPRPLIKESPYCGLNAFKGENEGLFFGRDELILQLKRQLEKAPLLVVIGASGSGKSSVVRAGLLPE